MKKSYKFFICMFICFLVLAICDLPITEGAINGNTVNINDGAGSGACSHNAGWSYSGCTVKCIDCGYSYKHHSYSSGTCVSTGKCTKCGASSGSYGSHSYGKTCPQAHCSASVCSYCGAHKGSCGGGHTNVTCSHCKKVTYCTKCTSHSCPCNSSASCSNPHCKGMRWCSYCGSHSHRGCDSSARCPKVHCGKAMCSVCGKHSCTGGHKYVWITNDTGEVQTHIYHCSVAGCTATNGTHTSVWGKGNTSHTSVCTKCNTLKYTHEPVWSTESRSATAPHPCVWGEGCAGTHTATWGEYYKMDGGESGDEDGSPHTRVCSTCGITEIPHNIPTEETWGEWYWGDKTSCERECKNTGCDLIQKLPHVFGSAWEQKNIDAENHTELYKHWNICTRCDPNHVHREIDDIHTSNNKAECSQCGQVLWKILSIEDETNTDITEKTLEENIRPADRPAKREEKITILEVVDNNGSPKIQYIKNITGQKDIEAVDKVFLIDENGTYEFTSGWKYKNTDGEEKNAIGSFLINNISREVLVDKIVTPNTSTPGKVIILIRPSKSEESFDKSIGIKYGKDASIALNEMKHTSDDENYLKYEVTKNGIYYFTAKDNIGNVNNIKVVIDNIINGQTTVAIANDVFINGYIFTDILINPNKEFSLDATSLDDVVYAYLYKVGDNTGKTLIKDPSIKLVKVMDMQRNTITKAGNKYNLSAGSYYLQVAIGGNIFAQEGTYIIDLENIVFESQVLELEGQNRIIVEVQDLKDLT